MLHPAFVEIHLGHLRHNLEQVRRRLGPAEPIAVVKADAYGHGLVPVARTLQEAGMRHFAVARLSEAVELREAGITGSILLLGAAFPEDLAACVAHEVEVTVSSPLLAEAVCAAAPRYGPLRVHVKVDTGMGRLGIWPEEAPEIIRRLEQTPGVTLVGLCTHLATAEQPGDPFVQEQLERFEQLWRQVGDAFAVRHVANSGALFTLPSSYWSDSRQQARIGAALYGYLPVPSCPAQTNCVRSCASWPASCRFAPCRLALPSPTAAPGRPPAGAVSPSSAPATATAFRVGCPIAVRWGCTGADFPSWEPSAWT